MADTLFVCSRPTGAAMPDSNSRYQPISGCLSPNVATTGHHEVPIRDAGTASDLFTYVEATTLTVTTTVTMRVSQADSALTVSYTSGQTGIKEDTSNSVSVAATDELEHRITVPAQLGSQTITFNTIAMHYVTDTASNTLTKMVAGAHALDSYTIVTDSVTRFPPPAGSIVDRNVTNENTSEFRFRFDCTSQDFYVFAPTNARTTNTVMGTRKNSADGGQTITYTSGQTGAKEDTSGTDSLAAGDDYNYYWTTGTGSGEALAITQWSTSLISTGGVFAFLTPYVVLKATVALNTTTYAGLGHFVGFDTVEANSAVYPQFTFTAEELLSSVLTNTNALSSTDVFIRDNLGDSAVTVSYLAGETGLKSDTSNTVEITSGSDEIDYKVINNELISGSIIFNWIGCSGFTAEVPAVPSTTALYHTLSFMGVG